MSDAEETATADSVLALLRRWYQIPVLATIILFMFWTRFQNWEAYTREGEGVWLQAIDSWYHWRATNWMIDNFPSTLTYDIWTGFPDGATVSQFGTLFDSIVAAVALIIGLGNPSEGDVLLAVLITVPAMGALVAIPVYLIGKRLGTRIGGLAGVAALALFTGGFFTRSTAGQFDHHIAEALFMSIAVLAVIYALSVGERERPIWELVIAGEWNELRRTTIASGVAGVGIALYLWVWPPGVVLIGILGVFFVLQLSLDYYKGTPPDHLAYVGVVMMSVVAALMAIRILEPGFGAASLNYLPPTFALLVAGGCIFMAVLARFWDERNIDRRGYPLAVGGAILLALAATAVIIPPLFDTLVSSLSGRLFPFGYSPGALTVGEAQPPGEVVPFMTDQFSYAFFTGLVALPLLAIRSALNREARAEHLFVLVWAVLLISMGMTQKRFSYYTAVAVAVLNAHLVGFLTLGMELPESIEQLDERVTDIQVYQIVLVIMVAMLVFMPLLPPLASNTPVKAGDQTGPKPSSIVWEEPNEWMQENTPAVGNYGGANNSDLLDYNGQYYVPSDGSYDYPEGAYGILSWWDYGHLITVQGERMPHANPFQQHAQSASAFLTSQNETQAELYLDAIAAGKTPTHESNESELREAVETSEDQPGIQYVMIDDQSAGRKFSAITQWTGPGYGSYIGTAQRTPADNVQQGGREARVGTDYYDTMLARLYLEDATGLEHYRLIHESPRYAYAGFANGRSVTARQGPWSPSLAQAYTNLTRVRSQNISLNFGETYLNDPYIVSRVKTFERVEGATITGDTEPNATVSASIELQVRTNRTFDYQHSTTADTEGSFELTVPYPTAETLTPEDGYANSSVRATGPYVVQATQGREVVDVAEEVNLSESAVQLGETVPVDLKQPAESNLSNLDIGTQGTNASIPVNTTTTVSADIENVGERNGSFRAAVSIENDQNSTESQTTIQVDGGASDTVTFEDLAGDLPAGDYDVIVGTNADQLRGTLTIEGNGENETG